MGRRLGELTNDNTKCMLEVNGTRLINRTLDAIAAVGIKRAILVVGYKAENVKKWVGQSYNGIEIVYIYILQFSILHRRDLFRTRAGP